jgi:hypothetical protein
VRGRMRLTVVALLARCTAALIPNLSSLPSVDFVSFFFFPPSSPSLFSLWPRVRAFAPHWPVYHYLGQRLVTSKCRKGEGENSGQVLGFSPVSPLLLPQAHMAVDSQPTGDVNIFFILKRKLSHMASRLAQKWRKRKPTRPLHNAGIATAPVKKKSVRINTSFFPLIVGEGS